MITHKKNLPNSRLKLTISATAAQFREAFEQELGDVAKKTSMPGFRAGKAPKSKVLEKVGRAQVEAGALERIINDVYISSIQADKITPLEIPQIDVTEYTAPAESDEADKEVVAFTAEVDVLPEVVLKDYKKLKLKKPAEPTIEPGELEKIIDYLRRQNSSMKQADPEATVVNGLWADISFKGTIGGVTRPDMASDHHPLIVGEGQLIPGFEEAMQGLKAGEERTFKVVFPEDYHAKEMAGKEAEFSVTINELKTVELPPLDEEFAKKFGHDSVEKLEEAIGENLKEEKAEESKLQLENEALDALLEKSTFEVPVSLVRQEIDRMLKENKQRVEKMRLTWAQYLQQMNKDEEQISEEMHPQAERNVKIGLALGKFMQEEGIENNDEAGRVAIERLLTYAV